MSTADEVALLASKGLFEEAIDAALELEDPTERLNALTDIALHAYGKRNDLLPSLFDDALKILKKIKNSYDRAYAYSKLAYVYSVIGDHENAAEFFDRAADEVARIKSEGDKALALSVLAYYLAISGFIDEAISSFNEAFDMLISASMDYRRKLDVITEVAGMMENAGDALHSRNAIRFYEIAYDIFDKLYINQRAAEVEKKLEVAKIMLYYGYPDVREALLEGRYQFAVSLLQRRLKDPQELFMALLEVAHWMKHVGAAEYLDVLEAAFKLFGSIGLTEENVQRSAAILTDMGELEKALKFALEIKDLEKRDDALAAIALKLAEKKEFADAREVVKAVSNPMLKAKLAGEIGKLEDQYKMEF